MDRNAATCTAKARKARHLQPSRSYIRFESVINRSLNLFSLQAIIDGMLPKEHNRNELPDMTRASLVLAVAAMDAYFTGIFAERLVPFLKRKGATKDLVELLKKAGLDTAVALELLGMQRPYRRIRTLVEGHLGRHVTQHEKTIDELFLAFGLKEFCRQVEKKAGRTCLCKSITAVVQRRHQIAHKGDLNSYGKLRGIERRTMRAKVLDIVKFVSCADDILQRQLA